MNNNLSDTLSLAAPLDPKSIRDRMWEDGKIVLKGQHGEYMATNPIEYASWIIDELPHRPLEIRGPSSTATLMFTGVRMWRDAADPLLCHFIPVPELFVRRQNEDRYQNDVRNRYAEDLVGSWEHITDRGLAGCTYPIYFNTPEEVQQVQEIIDTKYPNTTNETNA